MKNLFFIIISFLCVNGFAQTGGNEVYSFLNLTSSSRLAMHGSTMVSLKENEPGLGMAAPSLLSSLNHQQIALNYINYVGDINYGFAQYVHAIDSIAVFSAGIQFLNYGTITTADATGERTGEISFGDYALVLGAGRDIDSLFSVGANLKFIYSDLYIAKSFGMAMDVSGTYNRASKGFCATLLLKNMGIQIKPYYEGNREKLPFEIQLGVTKKLKYAPIRFTALFTNLQTWKLTYIDPTIEPQVDPTTGDEIPVEEPGFLNNLLRHINFGTEFLLGKNFYFGGSFNYKMRQELRYLDKPGIVGFGFGLGMKIKKFQIGYAFNKYHLAGAANTITITTRLSDFRKVN
jgi:hypothetical protein